MKIFSPDYTSWVETQEESDQEPIRTNFLVEGGLIWSWEEWMKLWSNTQMRERGSNLTVGIQAAAKIHRGKERKRRRRTDTLQTAKTISDKNTTNLKGCCRSMMNLTAKHAKLSLSCKDLATIIMSLIREVTDERWKSKSSTESKQKSSSRLHHHQQSPRLLFHHRSSFLPVAIRLHNSSHFCLRDSW